MSRFIFTIIFPLLMACAPDAAHDNPLDPANNRNVNQVSLSGSVFSFYQPFSGIEDAQIEILEAGRKTISNEQGFFSFTDLPKGTFTIITTKKLYQADTLVLELNDDLLNQSINLNALPHVESLNYLSENKTGSIFEQTLKININVIVNDFDGIGDIDSVIFSVPRFDIYQPLNNTGRFDSLSLELSQLDFNTFSFYELVQHPARLVLKDKPGARFESQQFFLKRIIDKIPQATGPESGETVIQPIFFQWERMNLPYSFEYEIDIYRVIGSLSTLVRTVAKIDKDRISYSLLDFLPAGFYYWTLSVRDELGNRSQSTELSFQVE